MSFEGWLRTAGCMARPQRALVVELRGERERGQAAAGPSRRKETSLTGHWLRLERGRGGRATDDDHRGGPVGTGVCGTTYWCTRRSSTRGIVCGRSVGHRVAAGGARRPTARLPDRRCC